MLTGGPNYMMIRRAIFGKVHARGVKVIWLISQFGAKHKGVASVFARPGLPRLLGYGHGVINNGFIVYIAYSPQSDCISLFRDVPSVTVWRSRIRFYVRNVILVVGSVHKQSREKDSWLSEKKEGAFKNTKIKRHYKFHLVTVRKLLWIRPNESSLEEGEGGW